MKPLSAAIAAAILAGGVATASAPAQAGPILDAMKKRAQTARGIAKEGIRRAQGQDRAEGKECQGRGEGSFRPCRLQSEEGPEVEVLSRPPWSWVKHQL